ncbi:hypothetical protein [Fontibacter flavus]|uniref:Uncharacterized protein n=1 Tax=Fontibacter flavus TaxID=654838 RepID=A0ABV6FWB6_9BACT|nr:hypothetical protein [Cyclobacteriaceae bacterium]
MSKKGKNQAEFVKWFGPLLNALRELGGSGKPREVSEKISDEKLIEMFKKVELGVKPKTVYEVDLAFFEPYVK